MNNVKCPFECEKPVNHKVCKEDFCWNPNIYARECDKAWIFSRTVSINLSMEEIIVLLAQFYL